MMTAIKEVDVIIIGAGPAGLTLANWFRHSNITVLVIDKKHGPTCRGKADGLKSTTNEIFETFGIGPQIEAESWRIEEIAIWGPSATEPGIVREEILFDKVPELGKPRESILQQGVVEYHLLNNLISHDNIKIRYGKAPVAVTIDPHCPHDASSYPVTITFTSIQDQGNESTLGQPVREEGFEETIRAKYIVGCDGAHSWLRKQLGVILEGDLTDSVFGVIDIIPKTNFPDIRRACYIRNATGGTILVIPRSNKEVRLYIPVEKGGALSDPGNVTFPQIMEAARRMMAPYTLEAGFVSWWSSYRVGQRVGSKFSTHNERAFLVGDAVHTHSPKAGQGMNTSIQDAYNLGFKLRLVLQGRIMAHPERLLKTYETERRPIAQDLIAFDRGYLKLFAEPSPSLNREIIQAMRFTTGLSIRYPPSCLVQLPRGVGELGESLLKADLVPGKRLQDVQVVYHADGIPVRLQSRMKATGSFRVIVFAGDIDDAEQFSKVQRLGDFLANHTRGLGSLTMMSPNRPGAPESEDQPAIEVLLIHSSDRFRFHLTDLHEIYRPWSEKIGYDYWRVFADGESAHDGHGRAFERLEIDKKRGCCAAIRPDGYIGAVMDLEDEDGLRGYFEGVGMLVPLKAS